VFVTQATNLPSSSGFTDYSSDDTDMIAGVAFSGVVILSGVSMNEVDPLYPTEYGSVTDPDDAVESFDSCLGHPTPDGVYHYHVMAPCSVATSYGTPPASCYSTTDCNGYELTYGESAYDSTF
jgi:hypothetical protein